MLKVTLKVHRFTPESDKAPHFETHEVEVGERASILDALFAAQRAAAPDLAFRFSCRVGMCGSCAMVVNGRERLTCSTLVKTVGTELRIEPLRNVPVVRDLATDLKPFFDAYQRSLPHLVPREGLKDFEVIPEESATGKSMDHQPQCIDCGSCYSACSLVTLHPRYLGPMALHRALTLVLDPRDAAREQRMAMVAGEAGAFRCHTLGNCRDVCPRGISPTASIERLKRISVGDQFRGFLSMIFGPAKKQ
ncbi:MAG: Succinate dehydrogenase and fumarate reductase iron-sulfur protein [Pedosphaera sp.]|nr:Succinate dehydrogenase and fumarate reductase iron-sulfur protein [Pedosphaera sp.]